MSLHTTLNLLKLAGVCGQAPGSGSGYDKLRSYLGEGWSKTAPIPLLTILESNGLEDTLWCLGAVLPEEEELRDRLAKLVSCDFAEHVLPLFEAQCPGDDRVRDAISVGRRYALGEASKDELEIARTAAWTAARAATWATGAATGAAGAAEAARAAWAAGAAWPVAGAAARAATWAAAEAARAATWATTEAVGAAGAAARAAESTWQTQTLRGYLAPQAQGPGHE